MGHRISAEQRRIDLVRAAVDVMSQEGFDRATTRRVAEAAGASQAAFHYAFRDKQELLVAVAEENIGRLGPLMNKAVDPERGLEEALRDALAALWAQVLEDDGYQLMQFELVLHCRRTPGLEPLAVRIYDDILAMMTDIVTRACAATDRNLALPARTLARQLTAQVEGVILRYEITRDRAAAETDLDLAVRSTLFLAGPP
ncbi:TetR/AcrR family transcriptional regulator [Streptomyces sp. NPDC090075]|uniref:TetR/AcrR family transcriptional regulator n=1 Tax=Streptomyces sp. NPDC090075 TaxID=3365937 RepID=UPI0038118F57